MFWGHLAHVALRVDDVEGLTRYYERALGLTRHRSLDSGAVLLGWGSGHHALELHPGEPGLDHFALEVPDAGERHALADRLGAGLIDDTIETHDPDENRVLFVGALDRSGERCADPGRRPVRVQHITLSSPQRQEMVDFYSEKVGFRITDQMGEIFTWLRSDHEHHSLAVVSSEKPGMDHYSYDVDGWEDFKVWCDELATKGQLIAWGPGRHGPGNNLFIIFVDPAGHRVELSAEMERYWDDRSTQVPRNWEPKAETVNLWGPVPSWRNVG